MRRERIKELLDAKNVNVSSFARQIGVSQPTLYRIISGEVNIEHIGVNNFMRIAHGLGLTAEQLYYDLDVDDAVKSEIDSTYSSTNGEGRRAILATARGVRETYVYEDVSLPKGGGKGAEAQGLTDQGR